MPIFTTNLIQNKITITHSRYNEFSFPLSVSFESKLLDGIITVGGIIAESANARLDIDRTNNIIIVAQIGGDIVSYSTNTTTGALVRLDSFTPPIACSSIAVYPGLGSGAGVVFLGNVSNKIYSYPYDTGGNFGALIDELGVAKVWDLSLDTTNNKLYAAVNEAVWGAVTASFDTNGDNLAQTDSEDRTNNNRACVFDSENTYAFYGNSATGKSIQSYSSTAGAILTAVNNINLSDSVTGLDVDGENGALISAVDQVGVNLSTFNAGVSPSLTSVSTDHQGTTEQYYRVRLNADNLLAFMSTQLGLLSYKYTTSALKFIQNENTYVSAGGDVAIDFTGDIKFVWMTNSSGISWYTIT